MLYKNDLMMLNDIIYKIYTIEDFDTMRNSVLSSLKLMIPYDIGTFSLASTDEDDPYTLVEPVYIGLPPERWTMYADDFSDMDYTRWTFAAPIAKAYRESDLMTDEARINTPYYQNMFKPVGIHHSAILTLIKDGEFYGCINLFRRLEDINFTDQEMLMLDMLKDHLSYRLSREKAVFTEHTVHHPDKDKLEDQFGLTRREIEILFLLLDGTNRDDISNNLSISPNTLKKHTANIYKKTSVNSYRELLKLMGSLHD